VTIAVALGGHESSGEVCDGAGRRYSPWFDGVACWRAKNERVRGRRGFLPPREAPAVVQIDAEGAQRWILVSAAARWRSGEEFPCVAWGRGKETRPVMVMTLRRCFCSSSW